MRTLVQEVASPVSPVALTRALHKERGVMLLEGVPGSPVPGRYSIVVARPFLTFEAVGSACRLESEGGVSEHYGNPWSLLAECFDRYEVLDQLDAPYPLGGCFGFWGYGLAGPLEPRLSRNAVTDLSLPDAFLGFHSSLWVKDHELGRSWIVSTGLGVDGTRSQARAEAELAWWTETIWNAGALEEEPAAISEPEGSIASTFTRAGFIRAVEQAQHYIRNGHIYQVNLSQRLRLQSAIKGWSVYERLRSASPAPYAAFLNGGDWQISSSSPELFLRISGDHVKTRPIKGTRPRSADPTRDAQLTYELQTSPKEMAELVMITDLLRNDLGRVCEYGTVQVPELVRLERHPQVQHLVSTVEGSLRPGTTHLEALQACFPGGSITGAPKIRAMQIIDELEPVARGPYTGALGWLGFNRESQWSIIIRTAITEPGVTHFPVGAGIVADSIPEAEYEETLAKARGFLEALRLTIPSGAFAETAQTFTKLPRS